MKIHFVCSGNTFRSRLAEAYFNSLQLPEWHATSSGIRALTNENGLITWYAAEILTERHILSCTTATWMQTTKELLEYADIVIYMSTFVYEECVAKLTPVSARHEVWDIQDIDQGLHSHDEIKVIAEATFALMAERIDGLVREELTTR